MSRIEISRELVYAGYGYETKEKAQEALEATMERLKDSNLTFSPPDVWITQKVWNYRLKGKMIESNETPESETSLS